MRIQLILLGLILIVIIFAGCTSGETADNLSNQDDNKSLQQFGTSLVPTTEVPVLSHSTTHNNETEIQVGNLTGMTSPTAHFNYDANTSFELSHGPVTIQRNATTDSRQSYIVTTNMTLTNTGLVPIQVNYATVELKDDVGDNCLSGERFICGQLALGPLDKIGETWLNPGESYTETLKITIFSLKSLEYLSSQKFVLQGVFSVECKLPDGSITGYTGDRRSWLFDLNITETT